MSWEVLLKLAGLAVPMQAGGAFIGRGGHNSKGICLARNYVGIQESRLLSCCSSAKLAPCVHWNMEVFLRSLSLSDLASGRDSVAEGSECDLAMLERELGSACFQKYMPSVSLQFFLHCCTLVTVISAAQAACLSSPVLRNCTGLSACRAVGGEKWIARDHQKLEKRGHCRCCWIMCNK